MSRSVFCVDFVNKNIRDGSSRKTLRQQTRKQPIHASTCSAQACRSDSEAQTPRCARKDNVPKVDWKGAWSGTKPSGRLIHEKLSASRLPNNPSMLRRAQHKPAARTPRLKRRDALARTTSRRSTGKARGLAQNLRDGSSRETLRQQTLKQPLDGSTRSPQRLPLAFGHPPPQRLDVSTRLNNRPRRHARKDNVPKVRVDKLCGMRKTFGTVLHANASASRLSNNPSTCLPASDILPRRDSTRATTPANSSCRFSG